jgi:hypothetical protein
MAEKYDEFIEDIQNDIRQENIEKLWKKYGTIVVSTATLMLAASTGWMIYSNNRENALVVTSDKFIKASNLAASKNVTSAIGVFESIQKDGFPTYSALSHIAEAKALSEKGGADFKKAQTILQNLSKDNTADVVFRDYAALTYVKNEIDLLNLTVENDGPLQADVKAKLENLVMKLDQISGEDAPWALGALDLKGLILLNLKEFSKASEVYIKILQTPHCPRGLLTRADLMSQYILRKTAKS